MRRFEIFSFPVLILLGQPVGLGEVHLQMEQEQNLALVALRCVFDPRLGFEGQNHYFFFAPIISKINPLWGKPCAFDNKGVQLNGGPKQLFWFFL